MGNRIIHSAATFGVALGVLALALAPAHVAHAAEDRGPVGKITERVVPARNGPSTAPGAAPSNGAATPARAPESNQPADRGLSITSGAALNSQLVKVRTSGGTGSLSFRLLDPSGKPAELPPGLVFGSDGSLSGEAPSVSTPKTITYLIQVQDSGGGKASRTVRLTINPPLSVQGGAIQATAGGKIKSPVKFLNVSGGTGKYTVAYSNAEGGAMRMPSGLILDGAGNVSGSVPASAEKMAGLTATITDEGGARVSMPVEFNLAPALEIATNPVELTAGAAIPAPIPVVSSMGGSGAVRYTLLDKDGSTPARLPEGLRFDSTVGALTGLVPSTPQEGRYVVLAQDAGGGEANARFEWKVNPQLQISLE
ncbi:putative Ig domain protein [compost metagenome]|uniref:putative Ig domain-containing protein n=1 Tax=Achromobacter sp. Root83 TaxID=1736602 RepID=UPI000A5AAB97|nr:putative Ig domain-containing protein [Achromobacter sp. Root83]